MYLHKDFLHQDILRIFDIANKVNKFVLNKSFELIDVIFNTAKVLEVQLRA